MEGWLLQATVVAGVAALGLLGALAVWRPSPAVQNLLWSILLLKLLLPPLVPLSIVPTAYVELGTRFFPPSVPSAPEAGASAVVGAGSGAQSTRLAMPRAWILEALFAVWIGGSLVGLRRLAPRRGALAALLERSTPAAPELVREVGRVARHMRMQPPRLRVVPGNPVPFVYGLRRPTLVWPAELMAIVGRPLGRAVIAHELAHLRRRDLVAGLLAGLARALWWWNPVSLLIARRLHRTSEMACDAWALRIAPEACRAYGSMLTALATAAPGGGLTPAPMGRSVNPAYEELRARLLALVARRGHSAGERLAVALLAVVLALPLAVQPVAAGNRGPALLGAAGRGGFELRDGSVVLAPGAWMEVFSLDPGGRFRHVRLTGRADHTAFEPITPDADEPWLAETIAELEVPERMADVGGLWTWARVPTGGLHFNQRQGGGAVALWRVGRPEVAEGELASPGEPFGLVAVYLEQDGRSLHRVRAFGRGNGPVELWEWSGEGGWLRRRGSAPPWLAPILESEPR